jgi:hypothetical protein
MHFFDTRKNKIIYTVTPGTIEQLQWNAAGTHLELTYQKNLNTDNRYFQDSIRIFSTEKPVVLESSPIPEINAPKKYLHTRNAWITVSVVAVCAVAFFLLRKK